MKFACPKCGPVTSSDFALEGGGYWRKYSRSGPWGCPVCRTKLNYKCEKCGCVGTTGKTEPGPDDYGGPTFPETKPATFQNLKCPSCGFVPPFPVVGCLVTLAVLGAAVGAAVYFLR